MRLSSVTMKSRCDIQCIKESDLVSKVLDVFRQIVIFGCLQEATHITLDLPGLSEFFQDPWTLLVASLPEPALYLSTGNATFFGQALNICLETK